MKGFLEWFKSNTKMKRWLILILIGIALACYGMTKLFVLKEMSFKELGGIIVSFVLGFILVIIGIVYIQKRTLELMIEANNKESNKVDVKSLIFNRNVYDKGPKIVVIGGGSGLNTVLEGIKKYTNNITAIVTLSDYGAKISDSRKSLNLLPFEDIKNSMIALSPNENEMNTLMNYRFKETKLQELIFGDVFLSAMSNITNNVAEAVEKSAAILNIVGKVLPVTLDEVNICAELEDGTVVEEKSKITEMVYKKVTKIHRVYVSPSNCRVAPGVLEAIKSADAIILGPGSLYTNVIPNLLVRNVAKTIRESKTIKLYISNIMTDPGQTDNYSLSDHIKAIEEHAGKGIIDYCICDYGEIIPEFIKRYNASGSDLVELDLDKVKNMDVKIIQRNISKIDGEYIRHNSDNIAEIVMKLICDELKFQDKINDEQYVMLNTKLKDEKKKEKEKNKKANKSLFAKLIKPNKKENKQEDKKAVKNRTKSKFNEKYNERIQSIRDSEKTRLKNIEKAKSKKSSKK